MNKQERIQELKEMYQQNPAALARSFMVTKKTIEGIIGDFNAEEYYLTQDMIDNNDEDDTDV